MEEKFSVSLELITKKYQEGIDKVKQIASNVGNQIKENMTVEVDNSPFKNMNAESELLLNKINDIKATLTMAKTDNKLFSKTEILEMNAELDKLENQYNKINQSSNMFSQSFNKIQDGMNKSLKSAKRFALSLFGIQSIYRMLSRASSAYLSQDTTTSQKIQSAWIGLGSVFAPLLNTIANFTIKAVSYINVFIKALTGTDFLANAMAKSMKKANKSAGALSKTLAGFDELTNLDDSSGGASIDTSWLDDFKNVELDPTLVSKITALGTKVKEIWDKYFSPFFTFLKDNWDLVGKDIIGLALLIGVAIDLASGNWIGAIVKLVGFIILYWDEIIAVTSFLWEAIKVIFKEALNVIISAIKGTVNIIVGVVKGAVALIKGIFDAVVYIITKPFKTAWETVKSVWDGAKTYFKGLKDIFVGIFTLDGNKIKTGLKNVLSGMGNLIIGFIEGCLNALLIPLNAAIKLLNKIPGVDVPEIHVTIPKFPKLAVGTPNVERSGYAEIHEGEAVVPKKFNSDEYFSRLGGNNNEQTNKLLEELIDRVERIEINPYTTIVDVGQASQKYRSQQSRIMGEELN